MYRFPIAWEDCLRNVNFGLRAVLTDCFVFIVVGGGECFASSKCLRELADQYHR